MARFNQKTLMVVLLILLVIALCYILFDKYQDYRETEKFEVYQEGVQFGYQQAVLQMMQQLSTCQPVPLYAGNLTLNAVAVECPEAYQRAQDQQSATLDKS